MNRTGGVLTIISGILGILSLFWVFLMFSLDGGYSYGIDGLGYMGDVIVVTIIWSTINALLGIFAIIGGILAVMKKHWGWALAGAIAGAAAAFPTGIAGVILISMSRPLFVLPVLAELAQDTGTENAMPTAL